MADKTVSVCDTCGRSSADHYLEPGWIEWRDCGAISISIDRRPDGQARTRYKSGAKKLDFCDTGCLLKWLASLPGPWPLEGKRDA